MFNFATVRPSTSGTWWALSSSESWRRGFSGLDSKALRKCIYFASVAWVDEILYGTLAYPCTFRLSTPTLGVRGNFAKELLLHFSTWTESRHHAAQSPDLRISASIKHLSKADLIHCWQSTDHMQVVESHCNSEWFQSTLCSWSCYGFIPFWLFMRSSLAGLSMHANHISENLRPQWSSSMYKNGWFQGCCVLYSTVLCCTMLYPLSKYWGLLDEGDFLSLRQLLDEGLLEDLQKSHEDLTKGMAPWIRSKGSKGSKGSKLPYVAVIVHSNYPDLD